MSPSLGIATRGDLAIVRRATVTAAAGAAGRVQRNYVTIGAAAGERFSLHDTSIEKFQAFWGEDVKGDVEAICPNGVDVQEGDGLQTQSGDHSGTNFYVRGRRQARHFGAGWQRLALEQTDETFA